MGSSQFCIETLCNDNIRHRLLFSQCSPHLSTISSKYIEDSFFISTSCLKNFMLYIISMFYTYYRSNSFLDVSDN